jgi:uncharacterized protein (DUF169 family)
MEKLLGLSTPALAITFSTNAPAGVPRFEATVPPPLPDGRTGKVTAGCVFWMKAADRTFTTTSEDHGNCSVGSLTHGLTTLEEIQGRSDVAALVECEWVSPEVFPSIPTVKGNPRYVTYGPLRDSLQEPDVVFLRVNGKQAMTLYSAWPGVSLEGKPQCHIVALAKEEGRVALSVGCMLSRVRTGMAISEMTCAVPAKKLPELVERLRAARAADEKVAAYAAQDSKRFA